MDALAGCRTTDVQTYAADVLKRHLRLRDYGRKCTHRVLTAILFYAAARLTSLSEACTRLRRSPSDETLRQALAATLPAPAELQRRIGRALTADLPRALRKRPQRIAVDLHEVPYYGEPLRDPAELRRGSSRSGTTHFHGYATAYVVRRGYRFTVAMVAVRRRDTMRDVVGKLLGDIRRAGISVSLVLLDRGFFGAAVIRYLQASRQPFLMPLKTCGRPPEDPRKAARSGRRFREFKRSDWTRHSWQDADGRRINVGVAVCCRNFAGRSGLHGRHAFVYAYWRTRPGSIDWIRRTYRLRFGIETSYRQLEQARIRTSSRDPQRRLLFVAVALILRNAWVWLHLMKIGLRRGDVVTLRLHLLRFTKLLDQLAKQAERLLDPDDVLAPQPVPI